MTDPAPRPDAPGPEDGWMQHPPFTVAEVASFNAFQDSGCWHEFTCPNGHLLYADTDGLRCPHCEYCQDWAWRWMLDGRWRAQEELMNKFVRDPGGYNP